MLLLCYVMLPANIDNVPIIDSSFMEAIESLVQRHRAITLTSIMFRHSSVEPAGNVQTLLSSSLYAKYLRVMNQTGTELGSNDLQQACNQYGTLILFERNCSWTVSYATPDPLKGWGNTLRDFLIFIFPLLVFLLVSSFSTFFHIAFYTLLSKVHTFVVFY